MKNFKEEKGMKKKKKGFTLIELIAVIAILAILGAVLVPKITGYKNKAKKSNYQTTAKVILNAVKAYNSDAVSSEINTSTSLADAVSDVNTANSTIDTASKGYTELVAAKANLTMGQIVGIANGDFTLNSDGTINNITATTSLE